MTKTKLALIFGGVNTEHEVSIASARSVFEHLNKSKYQVSLIYINKLGNWHILNSHKDYKKLANSKVNKIVEVIDNDYDIFFPVLHGPNGEDGTIQGFFETLNKPYVGCDVTSSALCMDKSIQKSLCKYHNIPQTKYIILDIFTWEQNRTIDVSDLGFPIFVKPSSQGSSVSVIKVNSKNEIESAIKTCFSYSNKVIIEKAVSMAREIECSVLGVRDIEASVLGEIIPSGEFYDYDAKYIDSKSEEIIPAKIDQKLSDEITSIAINSYKALSCNGLARVDFLISDENKIYLNELNTMPGFTKISMYPKLWQSSGLSYPSLLDKLIELGFEKHQIKNNFEMNYQPKSNWHTKK